MLLHYALRRASSRSKSPSFLDRLVVSITLRVLALASFPKTFFFVLKSFVILSICVNKIKILIH